MADGADETAREKAATLSESHSIGYVSDVLAIWSFPFWLFSCNSNGLSG